MNLPRITAIAAAGVLAAGLAAFTPATAGAQERSAVGENPSNQRSGAVTLAGCLMKESDYRKAHNLGGGAAGGVGLGDEVVLVDTATTSTTSTVIASSSSDTPAVSSASSSSATCAESGSGPAYRITGHMEDKMKGLVGRKIEVSGFFQPDKDGESKLPEEVDVQAYREYVAAVATTAEVVTAPAVVVEERREAVVEAAPAPAPAMEAARVQPPAPAYVAPAAPAPEMTREALPSTASATPLIGLIGLLFLTAASGVVLIRPSKL